MDNHNNLATALETEVNAGLRDLPELEVDALKSESERLEHLLTETIMPALMPIMIMCCKRRCAYPSKPIV